MLAIVLRHQGLSRYQNKINIAFLMSRSPKGCFLGCFKSSAMRKKWDLIDEIFMYLLEKTPLVYELTFINIQNWIFSPLSLVKSQNKVLRGNFGHLWFWCPKLPGPFKCTNYDIKRGNFGQQQKISCIISWMTIMISDMK